MRVPRPVRQSRILLSLLLVLSATPLSAAIFTVGAGGAPCTHATINNALFAAIANGSVADEIRIARNQAYNNLSIELTDWSPATVGAITLAGGYDDCADTTPSGTTTIDGGTLDPVIRVNTSSQAASNVTLRDLVLSGSSQSGLRVEGGGNVTGMQLVLSDNGTGGAAVVDGGHLTLDLSSEVVSNDGPGITCLTGSIVTSAAWIHANSTTGSGGGLLAGSNCSVTINDSGWITGNSAAWGAGIFASSGASVTLEGSVSAAVGIELSGNIAAEQGGGIYATGNGTSVLAKNSHIDFNNAGLEGGGIWASLGATVTVDRVGNICSDRARCSTLSDNHVAQSNVTVPGAAAWVESGADLVIYQTYIERNYIPAASNSGSIIHAEGSGSTVRVEGVQLWNNLEADSLFEGANGALLTLAFVTASRNSYDGKNYARPLALTTGASASLYSSIYYPAAGFFVDGTSTIAQADCLIVADPSGLPPGATVIDTSDPQYIRPSTGDLQLRADSPAVDFCDTTMYVPTQPDIDGVARGFNVLSNPDGTPGVSGGVYDIGADELRQLFVDGFEAGSVSTWSAVRP